MRITGMIFTGFVAALVMTVPVLAKNAESQKNDDKSAPASCHAYQQAADGSWTALPCQEFGDDHTQHRSPSKGGEEERH
jgi:hypothetical protein